MTEQYSNARKAAEKSFSATQVEFFSKNHAYDEMNSVAKARDEKTQRLRAARLAKEQEDAATLIVAPSPKRKKSA